MKDLFTICSSALPDNTRVVGFRGSEGISRPYVFEIFLSLSEDEQDFDLADAISAKATLVADRRDGRDPFTFHGVFSALELVHELGGRALVRATLVPQLWQLTLSYHSRIFTSMSIPDILKEVLEDGGLGASDYSLKLTGSYAVEEHVCQYQEDNLAFIARWMEREGMYYYFEQGDDQEKLIITDSKSSYEGLDSRPIRFFPMSGSDTSSDEALHTFTCRHKSLPAKVKLKDYDYTKPTLDVSGSAAVSKVGLGEVNLYGARFFSPDDGKRIAKLRAEELLAGEVVYHGTGTAFYLRAGYTFKLEDHPRAAFDAKYLATEVEHYGNQGASTDEMRRLTGLESDEVYRVSVTAVPGCLQFRAEAKTPWPRIYGFENGTIDGAADSEYAQLDSHGRYNVKFKFDESDLKDAKASTWVRMLQPHGGGVEGWHFPLRKGTEVLLTFLGGDPDRPVIAGVVPNAHTPSPVTSTNHTRNVIQTGGRNRFEFEDQAGQQRITMQTPHTNTMIRMGAPNDDHNLIMRTDGTTLLDSGSDWDVKVGGDFDEQIAQDTTEQYKGKRETTISKEAKETWLDTLTSTITEAHSVHSKATRRDEIGDDLTQLYHGGVTATLDKELTETVTGEVHQTYKAGLKQDITGGNVELTVSTGNIEVKAPAGNVGFTCVNYEVNASGPWKWSCMSDHIAMTISATSETTIGIKNENIIGGKVESCVGVKAEFVAAVQIEANAGPHLFESPMHSMEGLMLTLEFALVDFTSATLMIESGAVVIV